MSSINRRDFLKLAGAVPASIALSKFLSALPARAAGEPDASKPGILVILFDAMTARNLSVYGYHRPTTPNLERFAQHALVYHSHQSAGNFTIPGTASLLTGTYPWTHRAFNESGLVSRKLTEHNMFTAIGSEYRRLAFPQNLWANYIVTQFQKDVDTYLMPDAYSAMDHLIGTNFRDRGIAYRALDEFMLKGKTPVSLVFGTAEKILKRRQVYALQSDEYPLGIPQNINYPLYFRLDELFAGLASLTETLQPPYLAYLHLFPPHAPYRPNKDFYWKYAKDKWRPLRKPQHWLSDKNTNGKLESTRRLYDEYISTVDDQFGRLLDALEAQGVFDHSYVIITGDHGEMFERGEMAHETPLLYDPVIHVPLLVSCPGQTGRKDIYSVTSSVDLLPTFLHLAGKPIPDWAEGRILPGLGGEEDATRSVFAVECKKNRAYLPLTKATIAMFKNGYKMIYYTGYGREDAFELYHLQEDLEELDDLYASQPEIAGPMRDELLETLQEANRGFENRDS
jgi:arylsulfatase A-like enzyme